MFQGKKIGVAVPAYNEEKLVAKVVESMPAYVDRVYIVDDGSTDRTCEVVSSLCARNEKVRLVAHEKNKGVGAAIVTGYEKCLEDGMDIAVVMAGDNQMDPLELPKLLVPVASGEAGYAKGNRMVSVNTMKGMPPLRRFGNWLLKWLTRVSSGNYRICDPQNGYAAVSSEALQRIKLEDLYPYYGYCNHLLAKFTVAGVRAVEVPIPARYQGEKSKIRYGKYIRKVSWLLLNNFAWRMEMKWSLLTRRKAPAYAAKSAAEVQQIAEAGDFVPGVSRRR